MAIKNLKRYKGTYEGGATILCDALTMEEAVGILAEETEPNIVQKVGEGIKVAIPDPALAFTTHVEDVLYTAGCRAYPETGGQVKNGQTVFLSAVAGEGYQFDGWYQGDTLISTDTEAAVEIASASAVPAIITYEAKFSAI